MTDVMQLGGNIELIGFSRLDPASLVVLKKIVGNYARQFSDKINVEKLSISMKTDDKNILLSVVLVTPEKSFATENTHSNLFIAIDTLLKKIDSDSK